MRYFACRNPIIDTTKIRDLRCLEYVSYRSSISSQCQGRRAGKVRREGT